MFLGILCTLALFIIGVLVYETITDKRNEE
jgi:hypothetical protein